MSASASSPSEARTGQSWYTASNNASASGSSIPRKQRQAQREGPHQAQEQRGCLRRLERLLRRRTHAHAGIKRRTPAAAASTVGTPCLAQLFYLHRELRQSARGVAITFVWLDPRAQICHMAVAFPYQTVAPMLHSSLA
eukprot:CAMPEP_0179157774 /NCGR_PEP_ID=MMETSP0796-20121207/76962_1 /TAXON_ID=73915 /ORGANISM="Pyrodinium bahamense, Strain pbaha01" /LENGTH=138 /DNA_ID=CAMNT_0020859413 /DNA_START=106 /DNA_END=522 /DNA_ORIENTATION=+